MNNKNNYFAHERAIIEAAEIGEGSKVWANAHILSGAVIGRECNICDGVFVEGDSIIGNRVTVKCGVQLWSGVTLEDDVFVGPNATFTNDKFPRSQQWLDDYPRTIVKKGASIGANSTILPGIEIGEKAMIGAGAVVTKSVPAFAIVQGNPGRVVGFDKTPKPKLDFATSSNSSQSEKVSSVGVGVASVHKFPSFVDKRGALTVGEFDSHLPFKPERFFFTNDVPEGSVRGNHAHKRCQQFLISVSGSCSVILDDGKERAEVDLNASNIGLFIPEMVWGIQYRHSADNVLLVFASELYDTEDYLSDYTDFAKI